LLASENLNPEGRISMKVNRCDGQCRTCGGTLDIVDADDATMTVECTESTCADSYEVETDAFGDGCMTYWPAVMAKKLWKGRVDDDA